ncbi:MAG: sensor histidine kinase [bacterium]
MPANTTRRIGLSFWPIFGLWTIPTLLSTFETVMFSRIGGRSMPVYLAFLAEAPQWYGWALLTPVIVVLGERFPLRWPPRVRNLIIHASASVSFSLLVAMADAFVNMYVRPSRFDFVDATRNWFLGGLPATTLAYFAIIALSYAVGNAARLRERETQLREAQLSALRMQIQPHFLFNSLNAIMALVRDQDTAQAVRALALLSDVLRTTVNAGDAHTTTLEQELTFVGRYLDLERIRFGDRLRVDIDVPDALRSVAVPVFVLQPFVENALKHGILRERGGNSISISARDGDGALTLFVRDDGQGLAQPNVDGVGIANVRARLQQLYGDRAHVSVRNADPGVEVEIHLPRQ